MHHRVSAINSTYHFVSFISISHLFITVTSFHQHHHHHRSYHPSLLRSFSPGQNLLVTSYTAGMLRTDCFQRLSLFRSCLSIIRYLVSSFVQLQFRSHAGYPTVLTALMHVTADRFSVIAAVTQFTSLARALQYYGLSN